MQQQETRSARRKRLEEKRRLKAAKSKDEILILSKVDGHTGDIFQEICDYYDHGGDGKISKDELQEFIEEATGVKHFTQKAYDEIFAQYDKDNSGELNKEEVEHFVKEVLKMDTNATKETTQRILNASQKYDTKDQRRQRLNQMRNAQNVTPGGATSHDYVLRELWHYFEQDGTRHLSKEEVQEYLQEIAHLSFSQSEFDNLFRMQDKDKLGMLDKQQAESLVSDTLRICDKQTPDEPDLGFDKRDGDMNPFEDTNKQLFPSVNQRPQVTKISGLNGLNDDEDEQGTDRLYFQNNARKTVDGIPFGGNDLKGVPFDTPGQEQSSIMNESATKNLLIQDIMNDQDVEFPRFSNEQGIAFYQKDQQKVLGKRVQELILENKLVKIGKQKFQKEDFLNGLGDTPNPEPKVTAERKVEKIYMDCERTILKDNQFQGWWVFHLVMIVVVTLGLLNGTNWFCTPQKIEDKPYHINGMINNRRLEVENETQEQSLIQISEHSNGRRLQSSKAKVYDYIFLTNTTKTEKSDLMKGPTASDSSYEKDLKQPLSEVGICQNDLGVISRLTIKTTEESYTMGNGDENCKTVTVDDGDCIISFGQAFYNNRLISKIDFKTKKGKQLDLGAGDLNVQTQMKDCITGVVTKFSGSSLNGIQWISTYSHQLKPKLLKATERFKEEKDFDGTLTRNYSDIFTIKASYENMPSYITKEQYFGSSYYAKNISQFYALYGRLPDKTSFEFFGTNLFFTGIYYYNSTTTTKFENMTGEVNVTMWNVTQLEVVSYQTDTWVQNLVNQHQKYFSGTPVQTHRVTDNDLFVKIAYSDPIITFTNSYKDQVLFLNATTYTTGYIEPTDPKVKTELDKLIKQYGATQSTNAFDAGLVPSKYTTEIKKQPAFTYIKITWPKAMIFSNSFDNFTLTYTIDNFPKTTVDINTYVASLNDLKTLKNTFQQYFNGTPAETITNVNGQLKVTVVYNTPIINFVHKHDNLTLLMNASTYSKGLIKEERTKPYFDSLIEKYSINKSTESYDAGLISKKYSLDKVRTPGLTTVNVTWPNFWKLQHFQKNFSLNFTIKNFPAKTTANISEFLDKNKYYANLTKFYNQYFDEDHDETYKIKDGNLYVYAKFKDPKIIFNHVFDDVNLQINASTFPQYIIPDNETKPEIDKLIKIYGENQSTEAYDAGLISTPYQIDKKEVHGLTRVNITWPKYFIYSNSQNEYELNLTIKNFPVTTANITDYVVNKCKYCQNLTQEYAQHFLGDMKMTFKFEDETLKVYMIFKDAKVYFDHLYQWFPNNTPEWKQNIPYSSWDSNLEKIRLAPYHKKWLTTALNGSLAFERHITKVDPKDYWSVQRIGWDQVALKQGDQYLQCDDDKKLSLRIDLQYQAIWKAKTLDTKGNWQLFNRNGYLDFNGTNVVCTQNTSASWQGAFKLDNDRRNLYIRATTFVKIIIPDSKTNTQVQALIDKYKVNQSTTAFSLDMVDQYKMTSTKQKALSEFVVKWPQPIQYKGTIDDDYLTSNMLVPNVDSVKATYNPDLVKKTGVAGGASNSNYNAFQHSLNEVVTRIKVCASPFQSGDNWITSIQMWGNTKTTNVIGKDSTNCGDFTLDYGDCITQIKVYYDYQVEYLSASTKFGKQIKIVPKNHVPYYKRIQTFNFGGQCLSGVYGQANPDTSQGLANIGFYYGTAPITLLSYGPLQTQIKFYDQYFLDGYKSTVSTNKNVAVVETVYSNPKVFFNHTYTDKVLIVNATTFVKRFISGSKTTLEFQQLIDRYAVNQSTEAFDAKLVDVKYQFNTTIEPGLSQIRVQWPQYFEYGHNFKGDRLNMTIKYFPKTSANVTKYVEENTYYKNLTKTYSKNFNGQFKFNHTWVNGTLFVNAKIDKPILSYTFKYLNASLTLQFNATTKAEVFVPFKTLINSTEFKNALNKYSVGQFYDSFNLGLIDYKYNQSKVENISLTQVFIKWERPYETSHVYDYLKRNLTITIKNFPNVDKDKNLTTIIKANSTLNSFFTKYSENFTGPVSFSYIQTNFTLYVYYIWPQMTIIGNYTELPLVKVKNDWNTAKYPSMNITYQKRLVVNVTHPDKNFSSEKFNYSQYFQPADFKSNFTVTRVKFFDKPKNTLSIVTNYIVKMYNKADYSRRLMYMNVTNFHQEYDSTSQSAKIEANKMFNTLTARWGKDWEGEYVMNYDYEDNVLKIRVDWPKNPIRVSDRYRTYQIKSDLNITKVAILYVNITNWEIDKVNHLLNQTFMQNITVKHNLTRRPDQLIQEKLSKNVLNVTAIWSDDVYAKYSFNETLRVLKINITNYHMLNFENTTMYKDLVNKYAQQYTGTYNQTRKVDKNLLQIVMTWPQMKVESRFEVLPVYYSSNWTQTIPETNGTWTKKLHFSITNWKKQNISALVEKELKLRSEQLFLNKSVIGLRPTEQGFAFSSNLINVTASWVEKQYFNVTLMPYQLTFYAYNWKMNFNGTNNSKASAVQWMKDTGMVGVVLPKIGKQFIGNYTTQTQFVADSELRLIYSWAQQVSHSFSNRTLKINVTNVRTEDYATQQYFNTLTDIYGERFTTQMEVTKNRNGSLMTLSIWWPMNITEVISQIREIKTFERGVITIRVDRIPSYVRNYTWSEVLPTSRYTQESIENSSYKFEGDPLFIRITLTPKFTSTIVPGNQKNGTHIMQWSLLYINVTNAPSTQAVLGRPEYKAIVQKHKKDWSQETVNTFDPNTAKMNITVRWLLITRAPGACQETYLSVFLGLHAIQILATAVLNYWEMPKTAKRFINTTLCVWWLCMILVAQNNIGCPGACIVVALELSMFFGLMLSQVFFRGRMLVAHGSALAGCVFMGMNNNCQQCKQSNLMVPLIILAASHFMFIVMSFIRRCDNYSQRTKYMLVLTQLIPIAAFALLFPADVAILYETKSVWVLFDFICCILLIPAICYEQEEKQDDQSEEYDEKSEALTAIDGEIRNMIEAVNKERNIKLQFIERQYHENQKERIYKLKQDEYEAHKNEMSAKKQEEYQKMIYDEEKAAREKERKEQEIKIKELETLIGTVNTDLQKDKNDRKNQKRWKDLNQQLTSLKTEYMEEKEADEKAHTIKSSKYSKKSTVHKSVDAPSTYSAKKQKSLEQQMQKPIVNPSSPSKVQLKKTWAMIPKTYEGFEIKVSKQPQEEETIHDPIQKWITKTGVRVDNLHEPRGPSESDASSDHGKNADFFAFEDEDNDDDQKEGGENFDKEIWIKSKIQDEVYSYKGYEIKETQFQALQKMSVKELLQRKLRLEIFNEMIQESEDIFVIDHQQFVLMRVCSWPLIVTKILMVVSVYMNLTREFGLQSIWLQTFRFTACVMLQTQIVKQYQGFVTTALSLMNVIADVAIMALMILMLTVKRDGSLQDIVEDQLICFLMCFVVVTIRDRKLEEEYKESYVGEFFLRMIESGWIVALMLTVVFGQ